MRKSREHLAQQNGEASPLDAFESAWMTGFASIEYIDKLLLELGEGPAGTEWTCQHTVSMVVDQSNTLVAEHWRI